MCGRYEFIDDNDNEEILKIIAEIQAGYDREATYKTGEIFPTNNVPVILHDGARIMKWGFPRWDKKGVIINAKSETAGEKKMFSRPLHELRCVVPSTGFFEWQKNDVAKPKDKYLFTTEKGPLLYMAGLYNVFRDGDGYRECFVILTRDANRYISGIHDRMPVILFKDEFEAWLSDEAFIDHAFRRDDVVLMRKLA